MNNKELHESWKSEIYLIMQNHYKDDNTEISQELTYNLVCKAREYYNINKELAKVYIDKLKKEVEQEYHQNGYPLFYAGATGEEINIMNEWTDKSLKVLEELTYE